MNSRFEIVETYSPSCRNLFNSVVFVKSSDISNSSSNSLSSNILNNRFINQLKQIVYTENQKSNHRSIQSNGHDNDDTIIRILLCLLMERVPENNSFDKNSSVRELVWLSQLYLK